MRDIPIGWLHARAIESYYRRHPEEAPKRKNNQPRGHTGVVYKYTNRVNGKVYIGQTINEKGRKRTHIQNARNGHTNQFYKAVRKYGWENFNYEVVSKKQYTNHEDLRFDLDMLEIYYISKFEGYTKGYNANIGGGSNVGFHHSEETRKHFTQTLTGETNPFFGRHHSEETKRLLRESKIGTKLSDEVRAKLSKAHRGRKLSEEHKRKLSEGKKGKPRYDLRGKPLSEEHRRKFIESSKGRLHKNQWRKVCQISLETDEIIKVWDTISIAARELQLKTPNIIAVCKGLCSHCGGYKWRYVDNGDQYQYVPKYNRKIVQYKLDCQLVQEWDSAIKASKSLGINLASIRNCLRNKAHSAGGFIWRYAEDAPPTVKVKKQEKRIYQLLLDNEAIREYPSIAEAAIDNDLKSSGIINCLKGRLRTCGGYKWKYAENEE